MGVFCDGCGKHATTDELDKPVTVEILDITMTYVATPDRWKVNIKTGHVACCIECAMTVQENINTERTQANG